MPIDNELKRKLKNSLACENLNFGIHHSDAKYKKEAIIHVMDNETSKEDLLETVHAAVTERAKNCTNKKTEEAIEGKKEEVLEVLMPLVDPQKVCRLN